MERIAPKIVPDTRIHSGLNLAPQLGEMVRYAHPWCDTMFLSVTFTILEPNYKLKRATELLSPLKLSQACKCTALLFSLPALGKEFIFHGTLSCLLIAHSLAGIWPLFLFDFFLSQPSKSKGQMGV